MRNCLYICILILCTAITNAKEFKIILYGDSLMAGYGLDPEFHLHHLLQSDLANLGITSTITNASVSGDTSNMGLNRLEWSLEEGYDLFVLGLGANDMLRGIEPEITKLNLEKIIKNVQSKNISILILGMQAPSSYGEEYQKNFNEIYFDLSNKYNLFLMPFYLKGVALNPDLNLEDGKHPNEKGIAKISKNLSNIIKNNYN
jgi:acyl-CoA thioesterase-1